jgi:hypothetical protein
VFHAGGGDALDHEALEEQEDQKIGIKERIDIANSAPQSEATLAEGRSVASIASDFGVSRQTIARVREAAAASIG